jgi:hypothetical protein
MPENTEKLVSLLLSHKEGRFSGKVAFVAEATASFQPLHP